MNEEIKKAVVNALMVTASNLYLNGGESALDEYLGKMSNVIECDVGYVKELIVNFAEFISPR